MSGLNEKFSKILVAIDGSQPSMDAADYAIAIAQRNEAELTALYVVSSPTTFDYTSDTPEDLWKYCCPRELSSGKVNMLLRRY